MWSLFDELANIVTKLIATYSPAVSPRARARTRVTPSREIIAIIGPPEETGLSRSSPGRTKKKKINIHTYIVFATLNAHITHER